MYTYTLCMNQWHDEHEYETANIENGNCELQLKLANGKWQMAFNI